MKLAKWSPERLKEVDEVAYIRFASVYREFNDINTFFEKLKILSKDPDERRNKVEKCLRS